MKSKPILSTFARKNLHIQGYSGFSDEELSQYKYGIRFAYLGCGLIVALALLWQSTLLWGVAMVVAFLAVILPSHPLDYLYNYGVRFLINKPPIPKRTSQGKFACALATVWLATVITLFLSGHTLAANLLVIPLLIQAITVGTIDFCVPSRIFNALSKYITARNAID